MWDWVKRHPYLSGGLVLVAVVLFVIIRRASANSAAAQATTAGGPSEGLQAAQLAAGVQQSQIQAQADVANNQVNGAVAAAQINANAQMATADYARQVALQNIVTSGQVQLNTNDATLQAIKVQTGGQVAINSQNVTGQVDVAGIQADVMKHQYDTALAAQEAISQASVDQSALVAQTQLGIAQYQAQTTVAGINADVAKTNIASDLQKYVTGKQADIAYTQLTQQGQTQRLGITAGEQVTLQSLADQHSTDVFTIQAQSHYNDIMSQITNKEIDVNNAQFGAKVGLIQSGTFNLGGEGGANTVAAATFLGVNPQTAAVVGSQGLISASNTTSNIVGAVSGLASGFIGALFGSPGKAGYLG
jgi:hypothetical protein